MEWENVDTLFYNELNKSLQRAQVGAESVRAIIDCGGFTKAMECGVPIRLADHTPEQMDTFQHMLVPIKCMETPSLN